MEDIFEIIKALVKNKRTKQKIVAEKLYTTAGNISAILRNKSKPSKDLIKRAELIYRNYNETEKTTENKKHEDPIIDKVIQMMESCDEETKRNILDCAEKEKLLKELMKERQEKDAAADKLLCLAL